MIYKLEEIKENTKLSEGDYVVFKSYKGIVLGREIKTLENTSKEQPNDYLIKLLGIKGLYELLNENGIAYRRNSFPEIDYRCFSRALCIMYMYYINNYKNVFNFNVTFNNLSQDEYNELMTFVDKFGPRKNITFIENE